MTRIYLFTFIFCITNINQFIVLTLSPIEPRTAGSPIELAHTTFQYAAPAASQHRRMPHVRRAAFSFVTFLLAEQKKSKSSVGSAGWQCGQITRATTRTPSGPSISTHDLSKNKRAASQQPFQHFLVFTFEF